MPVSRLIDTPCTGLSRRRSVPSPPECANNTTIGPPEASTAGVIAYENGQQLAIETSAVGGSGGVSDHTGTGGPHPNRRVNRQWFRRGQRQQLRHRRRRCHIRTRRWHRSGGGAAGCSGGSPLGYTIDAIGNAIILNQARAQALVQSSTSLDQLVGQLLLQQNALLFDAVSGVLKQLNDLSMPGIFNLK